MKNLLSNLFILVFVFGASITYAQKKADPVVHFKSNMHCVDCEKSLFEFLRFEKGVKDLKLDHVSNTIKVVYADKRTNDEELRAAVIKKGYSAEKIDEKEYAELLGKAKKEVDTSSGQHKH
jgi:periplasmic mercuric ion binding protein